MAHTKIEWTESRLPDGTMFPGYSYNCWWGCVKVSPACDHCYAENGSRRFGFTGDANSKKPSLWGKDSRRRFFDDAHWNEPLKWEREAIKLGVRPKVFCASFADVFEMLPRAHPDRERMDHERTRLWDLITCTPHLDWLLLTKRPANIEIMIPEAWRVHGFPDNVWPGASAENQHWLDARQRGLCKIKAKVIFLSCEPLKGYLDVRRFLRSESNPNGINWVIAGWESGPSATPSHPRWFLNLKDQCREAHVPYFHKQWGEWKPEHEAPVGGPESAKRMSLDIGDGFSPELMVRVGKQAAGAKLYGVEYREEPETYYQWGLSRETIGETPC